MKKLIEILKAYNCQHTTDEEGNGLPLVDILSSGETIKEGNLEIELLAEHILIELEKQQ